MFVRTDTDLPADPTYPTSNFEALGYKINEEGQIVTIQPPHDFFPFFVTDNDRANQVAKEAMHKCAREVIGKELSELGIKEVYLSGEMGTEMTSEKPAAKPFMRILATDPEMLKGKKDVVVVIGEHNQDVGIWAYRSLMREAGIRGASAIGLVKKLQKLELNGSPKQPNGHSTGAVESKPNSIAGAAPGLILFNPGQRLYSPALHEIMNVNTWQARPRNNALGPPCLVNELHNHIPGHTTASEHITTIFDSVLPKLVDLQSVRLWIVGISDGAENIINYLDNRIAELGYHIAAPVAGMAFMEPQHNVTNLRSSGMLRLLHHNSRAWVKSSSQPKGEIIVVTNGEEYGGETEAEPIMPDIGARELKKLGKEEPAMLTLSAGVDIDELIWPAVIDDVLLFFEKMSKEAREADERVAMEKAMEQMDLLELKRME